MDSEEPNKTRDAKFGQAWRMRNIFFVVLKEWDWVRLRKSEFGLYELQIFPVNQWNITKK